jgi:hypothetical protein
VIARQVQLLREALKTIPHEGFDSVTILDDALARTVSVVLVPAVAAATAGGAGRDDAAGVYDQQESPPQG